MIQVFLAVLSTAAAIATVVQIARLGYRWGFDPIDALVLAVGGYLGFLVVGGVLIDLTPWGLSKPGLAFLVLGGLAMGTAAGRLDQRVNPHAAEFDQPRLTMAQWGHRLGGWRALAYGVPAVALILGALIFGHAVEEAELTPSNLSIFVENRGKQHWLVVENQTRDPSKVTLALNGSKLSEFTLKPESRYATRLRKAHGSFDVTAYSGSKESGTVRLTDLRPPF